MNHKTSGSRLRIGATIKAVLVATALITTAGAASADALRDKWCSKVQLRFFVGGAEGDAFGTIVYNGAKHLGRTDDDLNQITGLGMPVSVRIK